MKVSISEAIKQQWERYRGKVPGKQITRAQYNKNIQWIADRRKKSEDSEFKKNLQEVFDII